MAADYSGAMRDGMTSATPPGPVRRVVMVDGRRTSLSLEPAFWAALDNVCVREQRSRAEIVTEIDRARGATSLTGAVRVFVLNYFREAAD